jgi:O-antigen ligase
MNSSGFRDKCWSLFGKLNFFRILFLVSPVFLLTLKHWTNLVVFTLFIGSLFSLINQKSRKVQDSINNDKWRRIIAATLAGPVFAVAVGQLMRGEFYPPNFDAPLRIALCAPIFWAISKGWLAYNGKESITTIWVKFSFPLTLLFTYLFRPSWTSAWGDNRITTYFVDPLSFGSINLLLSLLSLIAITFFWKKFNPLHLFFSIVSIVCGFYLAIMSGSRTGLFSAPLFLFIWLWIFGIKHFPKRNAFFGGFIVLLVLISFIPLQPFLVSKFKVTITELNNYQWDSMNENTSVGMRISFFRMAYFFFLESPLKGWGDLGWMTLIDDPKITQFASFYARDFARNGFHNEILTNTVRSGVCGLISSVSLLFIPIIFASSYYKKINTNLNINFIPLFLLFFMVHLLVSGMTTEVTNLVFLSSFIGLSIAVFSGETIHYMQCKPVDLPWS